MYTSQMKIANAGRKKKTANGSFEIILLVKLPGSFLNRVKLVAALNAARFILESFHFVLFDNGIKIVHFIFSEDCIEEFPFAEKMIYKVFRFNFLEVFLWVA